MPNAEFHAKAQGRKGNAGFLASFAPPMFETNSDTN